MVSQSYLGKKDKLWYYLPFMPALDMEEWKSALSLQESPPELLVILNGKPTLRPYLWRAWKNRSWIRLLSGITLKPFQVKSFLEKWISLLPDSHVNHSLKPECKKELMMTVGSDQISLGSLMKWDHLTSSWKMYQDSFIMDSATYSVTLPKQGTMQNGVVIPLTKLEHHTKEKESGSWPTPTAKDSMQSGGSSKSNCTLTDAAVRLWPTINIDTYSHQQEMMNKDGMNGSIKVDLNPEFVECLMGVPKGWSMHSTCLEMDSYHKWLQQHSSSWQQEQE